MKSKAIIACSALLAGCAPHAATHLNGVLSPAQVIRQLPALQGKRVTVRGYVRYGNDSKEVWESKEIYEGKDADNERDCISIFTRPHSRFGLAFYDRKDAILTGTVVKAILPKGEFLLMGCNAIGIALVSIAFPK